MNALADRFCALLRRRSGQLSVLGFFAGMFLLSQLSMYVVLQPVGTEQALNLQLTLSADAFRTLVDDFYRRGVVESYLAHFYYDFLHPLWYATLLSLLLARGLERNGMPGNGWLLLPWLAGLLDLLENGMHIYMVLDTANITPPAVWIGNGAALGKWGIAAVCVLAILVLNLRPAGRPRTP